MSRSLGIALLCVIALAGPLVAGEAATVLVSADTEGMTDPCITCPAQSAPGGLARRATLVSQARTQSPLLLLDAGNAFFGGHSADSGGKVIAAAYDAMGYDAVNISYRDFRQGKDATLAALKDTKFVPLSACLRDPASGELLFKPYVVKHRVAVIGLTEAPAALEHLPHLKQQLAGIDIRPPDDALKEWLPKARAEADRVIVLYYGSARGLRNLHRRFGKDLALIAAGGLRPDDVPADASPPVVASAELGKALAQVTLAERVEVSQVPVAGTLAEDAAMQQLLQRFAPRNEPAAKAEPPTTPPVAAESPATKAAEVPAVVEMPATRPSDPPAVAVVPATPPAAKAVSKPDAPPAGPALRRVAARPPGPAKGLAGVGLTAEQVNAAIDRGRAALWKELSERLATQRNKFREDDGSDLLAALALVHAKGHEKYPQLAADLRTFLNDFNPAERSLGTYQAAIVCMLIEALGDPVYLPKLRQLARMFVEFQCLDGSWDYGHRQGPFDFFGNETDGQPLYVEGGGDPEGGRRMKRLTPWGDRPPGDHSTSQFALLGLRAAARAQVAIDAEVWQRSLDAFRDGVSDDGGWGYTPRSRSYGSMTCAGICSIAINRFYLGQQDPADDPLIEQGLAWLEERFTVEANPDAPSHHYYYLYSLERLGQMLETEFIGKHEWYPLGARFLVSAQRPDGMWEEAHELNHLRTTSFALMFLTRATPKLRVEVKHGGSGTVKTVGVTPPPARLYLILDGSGSMLEELGGRSKFDIARDAIGEIVAAMPDHTEVALRVYGHRKRALEDGASEDTALEVPLAKLDRAGFAATLAGLRPRGKTPMALSLAEAKKDLSAVNGEPVTVILLTDGGEDSIPRKDPVAAAAAFADAKGVTFHIVGFDINQPDWSQQLREMAARGKARYWSAAKADALVRELRQAILGVPAEFTVVDQAEKELWRGQFGESRTLPEGQYQFRTDYAGQSFATRFRVRTDATTGVMFDASRIHTTTTQPAAPAFCPACGGKLSAAAKFCSDCGRRVAP